MDDILTYWRPIAVALIVIVLLASRRRILALFGVIMVPDDSVGVVTKKYVIFGASRRLPPGRIIALNGEAGYQADTLAPGCTWDSGHGNTRLN